MRFVIAGGGTGGHLFPGVAVAEELAARGHEVRFVGTARGIEARVLPRDGWALDLIDVRGLKGSGVLGLFTGVARIPRSLWQSFSLLRRHQPDVVIGVGGYASGPVVLAAALSGRPTAILEQNSVPGFTNRVLGRLVKQVFGAFESVKGYFPAAKLNLVGNPIRRAIRERFATADAGATAAVVVEEAPRLLVVGGSQGAHAVNELVLAAMIELAKAGLRPPLVHQSGDKDRADLERRYAAAGLDVEVRAFIDDMAGAYRAADLVIARAGASTLAELTLAGVPSLLIPFPHAADDHQTVNARELERAGAARLLVQANTTPAQLCAELRALLADAPARARMAAAARTLARPRAHADIADALEALVAARRLPARAADSQ